jgi:hypothetical protein
MKLFIDLKKGCGGTGDKMEKVMHKYKKGTLHSSTKKGKKVKSRKQAVAIAMSEAGKSKVQKALVDGKLTLIATPDAILEKAHISSYMRIGPSGTLEHVRDYDSRHHLRMASFHLGKQRGHQKEINKHHAMIANLQAEARSGKKHPDHDSLVHLHEMKIRISQHEAATHAKHAKYFMDKYHERKAKEEGSVIHKAHVHTYTRHTKSGKLSQVKEHEDKRKEHSQQESVSKKDEMEKFLREAGGLAKWEMTEAERKHLNTLVKEGKAFVTKDEDGALQYEPTNVKKQMYPSHKDRVRALKRVQEDQKNNTDPRRVGSWKRQVAKHASRVARSKKLVDMSLGHHTRKMAMHRARRWYETHWQDETEKTAVAHMMKNYGLDKEDAKQVYGMVEDAAIKKQDKKKFAHGEED